MYAELRIKTHFAPNDEIRLFVSNSSLCVLNMVYKNDAATHDNRV